MLNYANVLDRYAAVFSADALCLASCDVALEEGGTLLGFVLDRILGMPLPPDDAVEQVDPALPPDDVEIIRILNAMARRERGRAPGGAWLRLLLHDLAREGDPSVATLRVALRGSVKALRIPADSASFRSVERTLLEKYGVGEIRARLLNPAAQRCLFGPRAASAKALHVAGDPWTLPGVADGFATLHHAIRVRCRAKRAAAV